MRRRLRRPGAGQHVHVRLSLDRLPDVSLPLGGQLSAAASDRDPQPARASRDTTRQERLMGRY
jgi:hypothetical protein